jgi:hypothetical protein
MPMPVIREVAQYHTMAFSLIKRDHCEDERFHTLYLLGDTKVLVAYEPFLDYVHTTGRAKSLAWQKETAFSLGLFIDLIAAQDKLAKSAGPRSAMPKPGATTLLSQFSLALSRGTIGKDGIDPLGLYWEPKSADRSLKLLMNVTLFCDWLSSRMGTAMVNPWRESTYSERIAALRRMDARKPHQLLGYVATQDQRNHWSSQTRSVGIDRKIQRQARKKESKAAKPDGALRAAALILASVKPPSKIGGAAKELVSDGYWSIRPRPPTEEEAVLFAAQST